MRKPSLSARGATKSAARSSNSPSRTGATRFSSGRAELEQRRHHPIDAVDFGHDRLHQLGVLARSPRRRFRQHLRRRAHHAEGRPHLVRHQRRQLAGEGELRRVQRLFLTALELDRHLVEGLRQLPHFVARPYRQQRQLAIEMRHQTRSRPRDLVERAEHLACQPNSGHHSDNQDRYHHDDPAAANRAHLGQCLARRFREHH